MSSVNLISVYMENVDPAVPQWQKRIVDVFLPSGWKFEQCLVPLDGSAPHAAAIEKCIADKDGAVVILDVDCIPVNAAALSILADYAMDGALAGCVQRANHLDNGGHLYVGPFCMAFNMPHYRFLGSPKFAHSEKCDTGEELTCRWERCGLPVRPLWPTEVPEPMWDLDGDAKFGPGTTYGSKFYHQFCIRDGQSTERFVTKCREVLEGIN